MVGEASRQRHLKEEVTQLKRKAPALNKLYCHTVLLNPTLRCYYTNHFIDDCKLSRT